MVSKNTRQPAPYLVLTDKGYRVLGQGDFGAPGLEAIEVLGPYVDIQASGPLITIHDSTIKAQLGRKQCQLSRSRTISTFVLLSPLGNL